LLKNGIYFICEALADSGLLGLTADGLSILAVLGRRVYLGSGRFEKSGRIKFSFKNIKSRSFPISLRCLSPFYSGGKSYIFKKKNS
jgi:hypothetical protein